MKHKAIQRGVNSRSIRGGSGSLEAISQLRETGNHTRVRHSGRSRRDTPAHRRLVLLWSVMLSAVTLAVLVVALTMWLRPRLTAAPGERLALAGASDNQVRVAAKFESPAPEESLEMVKRALAIRSPDQVERLFRIGDADRAEVMEFFRASEERDGLVDDVRWFTSVMVDGTPAEVVLVTYKNKLKPVQRIAFLTPDVQGNWKVDFESFARVARPSWQQVLDGAAQKAVVRVIVRRDVYYNSAYGNDKMWTCYRLASLDREETIRGYCAVGSPEAAAMERVFAEDRSLARATLEIQREEGAEPLQFRISRVLACDWVVPDRNATLE